jgi:hypothetical protein
MLSTTRHARRFGLAAATLLIGLAAGSLARAENIPAASLEEDKKSCIAACVGRGKPPEKCGAACDCTTKAYGDNLSFEEYLALSNAVKDQKEPPKELLEKMRTITASCRAILQN